MTRPRPLRSALRGDELPSILVPPPGPKSRASAKRLRRAEGAAIWGREQEPIVWSRARGSVVEDLDGNRYLDLTAGFGVASLGHAAPEIRRAVSAQAGRLAQGLGDLMPHQARERLVRALAAIGARGDGTLTRVLLASTGSGAVELALKTAALVTGRRRVIAFQGAYHGESYGALTVTHAPSAPGPIAAQLARLAIHVPYLNLDGALEETDRELSGSDPPGAILVEPIQGRAGGIIPPLDFLPRLARAARERGLLVIYDEVLTGACRTGPFWAWERSGRDAEPDLLCAGKGIGGGVAIAALLGGEKIMDVWRSHMPQSGEAPHASTFYGHPLACAGAVAALKRLTAPGFSEEVERKSARFDASLAALAERSPRVAEVRVAGLLGAIELVRDRGSREPAPEHLDRLWHVLLGRGVLTVPGGLHGNVLSLYPPLTITEEQLECGVSLIEDALKEIG